MRIWALPHLAEAALLSGRLPELRMIADELAPVIEESGSPVGHIALAYVSAVTASEDAAEELFAQAPAAVGKIDLWAKRSARLGRNARRRSWAARQP